MADRILIVHPTESIRDELMLASSAGGCEIISSETAEEALEIVALRPTELVLCELGLSSRDGRPLVEVMANKSTVIALSENSDSTRRAAELGAYASLRLPIDGAELALVVGQARERERLRRTSRLLRRDANRAHGVRPIVAASTAMIDLLETLERAAAYDSSVLVIGPRGTGKEVLARAIHGQSTRRGANFVAFNCCATDEQRLASELFGHVRGAFPGADRHQTGLIAEADMGTLFLDDVGALSTKLQSDLLRVLQDEEVQPLGEVKPRAVDIRIVAATTTRLEDAVSARTFDPELLDRLNVIELTAPALRERRKDIPLLVDHFIGHYHRNLGSPVRAIADDALDRLVSYDWPGNLRELENAIEYAVLHASHDRVTLRDLPAAITRPTLGEGDEDLGLKRARRALEADIIRRALEATGGNRTHAAKRLEISHRALLYKLKEYGIRD